MCRRGLWCRKPSERTGNAITLKFNMIIIMWRIALISRSNIFVSKRFYRTKSHPFMGQANFLRSYILDERQLIIIITVNIFIIEMHNCCNSRMGRCLKSEPFFV